MRLDYLILSHHKGFSVWGSTNLVSNSFTALNIFNIYVDVLGISKRSGPGQWVIGPAVVFLLLLPYHIRTVGWGQGAGLLKMKLDQKRLLSCQLYTTAELWKR